MMWYPDQNKWLPKLEAWVEKSKGVYRRITGQPISLGIELTGKKGGHIVTADGKKIVSFTFHPIILLVSFNPTVEKLKSEWISISANDAIGEIVSGADFHFALAFHSFLASVVYPQIEEVCTSGFVYAVAKKEGTLSRFFIMGRGNHPFRTREFSFSLHRNSVGIETLLRKNWETPPVSFAIEIPTPVQQGVIQNFFSKIAISTI